MAVVNVAVGFIMGREELAWYRWPVCRYDVWGHDPRMRRHELVFDHPTELSHFRKTMDDRPWAPRGRATVYDYTIDGRKDIRK